MKTIRCAYCGKEIRAERKTKKVCSTRCEQRLRLNLPKERQCLECGKVFQILKRGDNNRRYCSQACSKRAIQKSTLKFYKQNPGYKNEVNKKRIAKNPGMWKDKHKNERLEAIKILGGGCIVCGVTNQNWIHIDYIPTTRGKPYRHPRHLKYIKEHVEDFRLLCANHHYELTLTGMIAGTTITQPVR